MGRFTPHRFGVAVAEQGEIEPFCDVSDAFAYLGQKLNWRAGAEPVILVDALNAHGAITRNYTLGAFQRLSPESLERTPAATDEDAVDANDSPFPVTANLGQPALTPIAGGRLQYQFSLLDEIEYEKRPETRVEPFSPEYRIELTALIDADGILAPSLPVAITPHMDLQMRYGRLKLENAYGSGANDLSMPFQAEYYTAGRFVRNLADSCWAFDTSSAELDQSGLSGGSTSVRPNANTLDAGAAPQGSEMVLAAPGDDSRGSVRVAFPVPVWLTDDVDNDGTLDDPFGLATFGVYRGHDRIIFWREVTD